MVVRTVFRSDKKIHSFLRATKERKFVSAMIICPDKVHRKIKKERSLMNDINNNNVNSDENGAKQNNTLIKS